MIVSPANNLEIQELYKVKDKILLTEGKVMLEGKKMLFKFLALGNEVELIICPQSIKDEVMKEFDLPSHIRFMETPNRKFVQEVSGFNIHQGTMAIGRFSLDPIDTCLKDDKILVLNGITKPENIGAIVRSARAFGISSIIFDRKSCSPLVKRAIRVSMGNVFHCNLYCSDDLTQDLRELMRKGYKLHVAHNDLRSRSIREIGCFKKSILLIGSEGHGPDREIIELADYLVKIPISDSVAHLNAACAASILFYEMYGSSLQ